MLPDKSPESFRSQYMAEFPAVIIDDMGAPAPFPGEVPRCPRPAPAMPAPPVAVPRGSVAIEDDPAWLREVNVWVLADGRRTMLSDMSPNHLNSSLGFLNKVVDGDRFACKDLGHKNRCIIKREELMDERNRRNRQSRTR